MKMTMKTMKTDLNRSALPRDSSAASEDGFSSKCTTASKDQQIGSRDRQTPHLNPTASPEPRSSCSPTELAAAGIHLDLSFRPVGQGNDALGWQASARRSPSS